MVGGGTCFTSPWNDGGLNNKGEYDIGIQFVGDTGEAIGYESCIPEGYGRALFPVWHSKKSGRNPIGGGGKSSIA